MTINRLRIIFLLSIVLASLDSLADQLPQLSGNLLYDIQNPFVYIPRIQFENHFDTGEGPYDASTYRLRMRPIIPLNLTEDLGLRTRTTFNMSYQSAPYPGAGNQLGFGDMDMEFWVTNNHSLAKDALHDALIVGIGPSVHIPTATQNLIGLKQWGVGASAAVIWQPKTLQALKGWTFGFNVNQSFGVATGGSTQAARLMFLNPGVSYTLESSEIVFNVFSETAYNWNTHQWTVPLNASIGTLVKPGGQNIVITLGGRYYAERGPLEPRWGAQLNFNFLFPE